MWSIILLSTFATVSAIWLVGQIFKPRDRIDYGTLSLYITGVILGQGSNYGI